MVSKTKKAGTDRIKMGGVDIEINIDPATKKAVHAAAMRIKGDLDALALL